MKFRAQRSDEPEINLIPFIDILLVALIFVMLTTTYARLTELRVELPAAEAKAPDARPSRVELAISRDGRFAVDGKALSGANELAGALRAASKGSAEAVVVISADASSTHQAMVDALQAAGEANLPRVAFAAQKPATPR